MLCKVRHAGHFLVSRTGTCRCGRYRMAGAALLASITACTTASSGDLQTHKSSFTLSDRQQGQQRLLPRMDVR